MPEPHRVPPSRSEAELLARAHTRLVVLAGNGGVKTLHAATNRRRIAITWLETDG